MARSARQLLRDFRDTSLVSGTIRLIMRGNRVNCPCCDSRFRKFRSFNGPDRVCWVCGAMERHRAVWLYLDEHPELLREGSRIVHVAPENVLRNRFRSVPGVDYIGGDLTAEFGPERIDVTDLDIPDSSVDILVCSHVLEHVPDDARAMAEIRRVLKEDGWALIQVPDLEGEAAVTTDEDPDVTLPEERLARFGQADHVRRYGWDFVDRLAAAGLVVQTVDPAEEFGPERVRTFRLEKRGSVEPIFICRRASD